MKIPDFIANYSEAQAKEMAAAWLDLYSRARHAVLVEVLRSHAGWSEEDMRTKAEALEAKWDDVLGRYR